MSTSAATLNNPLRKLRQDLARKARHRRALVACILLLLAAISWLAAWLIRFEGALTKTDVEVVLLTLPLLVALRVLAFVGFDIERRPMRLASAPDMYAIVLAALLPSVVLLLLALTLLAPLGLSRSVILIDATLCPLLIMGFHSSRLLWQDLRGHTITDRQRAIVVGNGEDLRNVLRELRSDERFMPVAVLTGEEHSVGQLLHGVRVYQGLDRLAEQAARVNASAVCFAHPGLDRTDLHRLTAECNTLGLEFVLLRSYSRGASRSKTLMEEVGAEVLLQREEVSIDPASVRNLIAGRRVLVTGAGGSIGSELCRQIAAQDPAALFLVEYSENSLFFIAREVREINPGLKVVPLLVDITDYAVLLREFEEARPELVFHAAAHKHVVMMEQRPQAAIRNNVLGTGNVARAAAHAGAMRFINISTDKAVRPRAFMGLSKRLAEMVVQEMNRISDTQFVSVRFGNVAGSNGSAVQLFEKQIRRGGPVTVTDARATRFFMSIPEAVRLVLQAAVFASQGGVFILEMGKPVRIEELARTMIRLSGFRPGKDIPIRFTGLVAGEKMHEELNDEGEDIVSTPHPRLLFIRREESNSRETLLLDRLPRWQHLLFTGRHEEVLNELCDVWPNTTQITANIRGAIPAAAVEAPKASTASPDRRRREEGAERRRGAAVAQKQERN
jgi:FlaA1/EpsC-like NDP-sugar epimerase